MKVVLLIIGYLISSITINAQTIDKYWNYRDRLNSDFLVVGTQQGFSVPAAYRNPIIELIKWSDATVDLGWYIGTLATEHYLLSNAQSYPNYEGSVFTLEQNTTELYYALKALQRLDLNAETSFLLCLSVPSENGFFIRDDTNFGFDSNFDGMSSILSDFVSFNIYDKEMSQDQVYHLLMGLSLVTKLVAVNVEYNGENLGLLAANLAKRITNHVAVYSNWVIKNPACNNKIVDRGPDAWALSFGTNQMIKQITDNTTNYDDQLTVILNEAIWPPLGMASNPIHLNSDNTHMIMTIAAVGNAWSNSTLNKLMNLTVLQDFYLYPLLHGVIHDPAEIETWDNHKDQLKSVCFAMLEDAPINGPFSPQPFIGNNNWGSNNRFIRKKEDHRNGGNNTIGQQYNGLDYMLLHNLYYILFECPSVSFDPIPENKMCNFNMDIDLADYGHPSGGTFSGPGISGSNFNPFIAEPGVHYLTYTIEDENCFSSDSTAVVVSVCTNTANYMNISNIETYPNPASDKFFIEYSMEAGKTVTTEIIDQVGRIHYSQSHISSSQIIQQIHLENLQLESGIYHIILNSENGTQFSSKVLVK